MYSLLLVMIGGGVGAGLRYGVGRWALAAFGPGFPWGTLAVNLIGGFAMGLLASGLARFSASEPWRLLLGVGVLGGFTTFSAFSLESYNMIARGEAGLALLYALVSVVGAIGALAIGVLTMRAAI